MKNAIRMTALMAIIAAALTFAASNADASGGFYFRLGYFSPTAQDSFEPVYGPGMGQFGLGGVIYVARERLAIEFGVDVAAKAGKRVYATGEDEWEQTESAQNIGYVPFTATLKYRFIPDSSVCPFIGGGLGAYYIREESDDENFEATEGSHGGAHLCGGVEFMADRVFTLTLEARFTTIPDAIGEQGTSAYYDETDAGGLNLFLTGTIRFGS